MYSNPRAAPSPVGSASTDERDMVDLETNGLHLELAPFGLEHIEDYEPDGHHPVHLGDVLGNNEQYHVIHKLGHGGFATVWLCRDLGAKETTKYVALKILMAAASTSSCPELRLNRLKDVLKWRLPDGDGSHYICLPIEDFDINGPNGKHICIVYPVLGPNVASGLFNSPDPDSDLRKISLQVVKAVKFLHSEAICHGDITPNNILHCVSGLDGLGEDQVLQVLGKPILNPILNESQEPHHESTAPKYLVYSVKWVDVDIRFIDKEACLIDFGESFEVSQCPDDLGTPGPYRSPELILEKQAGFGSDVWALACSLFEIRTGRKLFSPYGDEDGEYLEAMVQVLGRLPEPWWSTTWKDRRRLYKDEFDEQGLVVDANAPEPGRDASAKEKRSVTKSIFHPSVAVNARSLRDKLSPGLWYMSDRRSGGDDHREISQTEKKVFADLLGKLLKYKPEERISAEDAMKHEWFRL